jgi:protein SERAC1
MSSLGKVVASIAKLAFQTVNDDLIRDLERDSQILDRIRDSFSRILDRRTFTVWSFVEELATAGIGKVYIT